MVDYANGSCVEARLDDSGQVCVVFFLSLSFELIIDSQW